MRSSDQEVAATDAAWRWLETELASVLDKLQRRSVATHGRGGALHASSVTRQQTHKRGQAHPPISSHQGPAMSGWASWLSEQTSALSQTLSEGINDFSQQLNDDSTEVRREVGTTFASVKEQAGTAISTATERLEALSTDVDVPDTFVRSLAHVERAGETIRTGMDAALSSSTMDSVVKGVEGALGSLAVAAEGTAGMLGGVGGARGRADPRAAEPSGVAAAQRFDERVRAMEGDAASFSLPAAERAAFERWSEGFVLLDHSERIEQLLKERDALRATHASLVPSAMPYRTFWATYFYRTDLLTKQEKRRIALLQSVDKPPAASKLSSWDFDDEAFSAPPPASKPRGPAPLGKPGRGGRPAGGPTTPAHAMMGAIPSMRDKLAQGASAGGASAGGAQAASGGATTKPPRPAAASTAARPTHAPSSLFGGETSAPAAVASAAGASAAVATGAAADMAAVGEAAGADAAPRDGDGASDGATAAAPDAAIPASLPRPIRTAAVDDADEAADGADHGAGLEGGAIRGASQEEAAAEAAEAAEAAVGVGREAAAKASEEEGSAEPTAAAGAPVDALQAEPPKSPAAPTPPLSASRSKSAGSGRGVPHVPGSSASSTAASEEFSLIGSVASDFDDDTSTAGGDYDAPSEAAARPPAEERGVPLPPPPIGDGDDDDWGDWE